MSNEKYYNSIKSDTRTEWDLNSKHEYPNWVINLSIVKKGWVNCLYNL
jgi:hypothetical protein